MLFEISITEYWIRRVKFLFLDYRPGYRNCQFCNKKSVLRLPQTWFFFVKSIGLSGTYFLIKRIPPTLNLCTVKLLITQSKKKALHIVKKWLYFLY